MNDVELIEQVVAELTTAHAKLEEEYDGTIHYDEIERMDPEAEMQYYVELKYCLLALEMAKAELRGERPDAKYTKEWSELRALQ